VLTEITGCSAEHQALGTYEAMTKTRRPSVRPTDSHDDVDPLMNRIDEAVRERYMRLEQQIRSATALFPICQVRVMQAGAKAQALAASLNISTANAGIGLGAILGGLGIGQFGLGALGGIATIIAAMPIVVALLMMPKR
jgi:hypothetical protein